MKRIFILIQISILFSCQNNEQLNEKSVIESFNLIPVDSTNANFEDSILKENDSTNNLEEDPNLNNKTSIYPVNILEALELKHNLIGVDYLPDELKPWDSIIDVDNGYFELFSEYEQVAEDAFFKGLYLVNKKHIISQVKVFQNLDGSATLGITIAEYDGQDFDHKTSFYNISKSMDSIQNVINENMIPKLIARDLISDTVDYIIEKYLPKFKEANKTVETINDVIGDFFNVTYLFPQKGSKLTATLEFAPYSREYWLESQVEIDNEDWSTIFLNLNDIELEYDPLNKKFIRK